MNDDQRAGAEAAALRQIELIEADLLRVVRRYLPVVGHRVVGHALVQLTGSVLGDIAVAEPAARADLDAKLQHLRLFVATIGQQPQ